MNQVVNFSTGQNTATVMISLINVKTFQGTRNFTINLSNPSSCALGAITQEAVTITDNPVTATAPNVGIDTPVSSPSYSAEIEASGPGSVNSYLSLCATPHNSFGYADFPELEFSYGAAGTPNPLGYQIGTVDSLTVSIYNTATAPGGYGGTPGSFSVWALTDDSVLTSSLKYNSSASGDLLISGVSGAVKLGTAQFTNNVVGYNDFTFDNIPTAVSNAFVTEQTNGLPIRLVVIPNDPNVTADWEGNYSGSPTEQPKLTLLVEKSSKPTETFSLDQTSSTVAKNAGTYNLQIDRAGGADLGTPATVQVTLHDGTAVFGTDYTTAATTGAGVPFTVTIPTGQSNVQVPITLLDPVGYGDRAFSVTISNPSQANAVALTASPTLGTVTITDPNDQPTSETLGAYVAGEVYSEGDFETTGSYDSTEFKATDVNSAYPSFSVIDLQPLFAPANPITSISSATLTANASTKFPAAAGVVDFYLVSDDDPTAHPIVPQSPATKAYGFYDSTQGIEGLGSQFGNKILLGSFYYTASTVSIPLVQSLAGEQAWSQPLTVSRTPSTAASASS